jgi:aconitate hydratase A / 2-methylisocitrate dehydratase
MASHNLFNSLQEFKLASGKTGNFYSLPALEKAGIGKISRLPVSIRIVLESVVRNCDGKKVTEKHVRQLANWAPTAPRTDEIPFVVARIVLQDFTGVPLLCDLAAMRGVAQRMGKNPKVIEPLVPVDLVVDHSVQIDHYNSPDALKLNMELEFQRNNERYRFLKWGMQAFDTFKVVPPGIGIVHQVNLEYLARGVHQRDGVYYPDTLVGTDSHTTMINGIGVVGWGVGGIEAEAGMLGQPVYFLTPDVVGVHLTGKLKEGVTATDLVLTVTEMLRKTKVVGKFVEFFGEGTASLAVPDRATIANMAPEYGATMGFFPVDNETVSYLKATGRTAEEIDAFQSYFKAQGLYGIPRKGECDYSAVLELDLATVTPSVAGPKRPQDRIELPNLKTKFNDLFSKPVSENGYNKPQQQLQQRFASKLDVAAGANAPWSGGGNQDPDSAPRGNGVTSRRDTSRVTEIEMMDNRPTPDQVYEGHKEVGKVDLGHGDVLIAAITSCTNTSNPGVLLAAGLLAKKAAEKGLSVKPHIKTSLAPGSRVVTEYLQNAGLLPYLEQVGFGLAAYGCTTCIGNAGPLDPHLEETITGNDLVCAAVLSGNRNFEARIHANIKANFLMSPPLVVAFAIAGRVNIDMNKEPLGQGKDGKTVYLRDIWPTQAEVASVMKHATDAETYRRLYSDFTKDNPLWNSIPSSTGQVYTWEKSTYIAEPPFFKDFGMEPAKTGDITGARALGIFGDSVTTDHISPAGSIKPTSPAGKYLQENGVPVADFNSYGSRRGNHEVMMRGTFANVRIKNLMLPPKADGSRIEGGLTLHQPSGEQMSIYDAAMRYIDSGVPTALFGGEEYGTGSSRDWAAKGTQLLGVKAVIARSFERIHRSNLVGMSVLPCQFKGNDSIQSLGIKGDEEFDLTGLYGEIKPQQDVKLVIKRKDGSKQEVALQLRIDTPIEVDYYKHGGILPYVLRELVQTTSADSL